jgi:hypothetical protein
MLCSFPSCIRGFNSLRPLQYLAIFWATVLQSVSSLPARLSCLLADFVAALRPTYRRRFLHVFLFPPDHLGDDADEQPRGVEPGRGGASQVVEVKIALPYAGIDLRPVEAAQLFSVQGRRPLLVRIAVDYFGMASITRVVDRDNHLTRCRLLPVSST